MQTIKKYKTNICFISHINIILSEWLRFVSWGNIEAPVVFLTCVGGQGPRTQSKIVMFEFNNSLSLFVWLSQEQPCTVDMSDNLKVVDFATKYL